MPYVIKFAGKHKEPIDNIDACVWCYEVSWEDSPGDSRPSSPIFEPGIEVGLDFPATLQIRTPGDFTDELLNAHPEKDHLGTPQLKKDTSGHTVVYRRPNKGDTLRVCIIAGCAQAKEDIEVSFDVNTGGVWKPVEHGGQPVRKKLPGPA